VDVVDRLEAIGPVAWGELHRGAGVRSPFLSYTWQREWVAAFAPGQPLALHAVRDDAGTLIAVLPLVEVQPALFQTIGGVDVSDYLDLLAVAGSEGGAWSALLAVQPGDATWELHSVPAASPTMSLLSLLSGATGVEVTIAVEERCPVLDLPASWADYLASLSSKHRHELTRKMRRLARELPDAHVSHVVGADAVAARFDEFLGLHRRSRAGKARFMDTRMERFFRSAITALAGDGAARLWFLDTPAGPIASFVTIEWDGIVGLYNSGFDPERASLAPGLVLLGHLLQDAIATGKRRFDFLRGEERYKYEFGPVPEDVCSVTLRRAEGGPA
jgi:CelD/BcsL family acetyltransferase involved in cellulose biosynthesis